MAYSLAISIQASAPPNCSNANKTAALSKKIEAHLTNLILSSVAAAYLKL